MPSTLSPFDDDAPPPPRRQRRPWWRWNIITLAVVLFVLVWVRELLGLRVGATWAGVLSVFTAWVVGPMFFVPTALTVMKDITERGGDPAATNSGLGWWRRNGMLAGLRLLALAILLLSIAHLVLFLGWLGYELLGSMSGGYGRSYYPWERALYWGYLPLMEIFFSGCLYTLTVIALRLDHNPRDQ